MQTRLNVFVRAVVVGVISARVRIDPLVHTCASSAPATALRDSILNILTLTALVQLAKVRLCAA